LIIGEINIFDIKDNKIGNKKQIIDIDNITYGGDGIGALSSGKVIFVPKTIPGEKHLVEITKEKKNHSYGVTKNTLKTSKSRINPKCEVFEDCGGCQWQHINYEKQKDFKEQILSDSLLKIGKLKKIKINPIIGSKHPWYYRNKSIMPFTKEAGRIVAGFYKRGTHQVIKNQTCYIQHQLINRIKRYTLDLLNEYKNISVYDENINKGLLRHLHIRVGVCTNQALLTFITTDERFEQLEEIADILIKKIPELEGIMRNINNKKTNVILGNRSHLITGKGYIYDYIGNRKYKIGLSSFFQINTLQSKKLYDVVQRYMNMHGNEIIVDAYSGIGSIAISLKENYEAVYGIESNQNAVKDSCYNAAINGLNDCYFIKGDVTKEIPKFLNEVKRPDIIIFDPPRSGLNKEILKTVIDHKIKEIIYVSCNPTTLARDLKILKKEYDILKVQPVDMFPQTYHIETVVKLRRLL